MWEGVFMRSHRNRSEPLRKCDQAHFARCPHALTPRHTTGRSISSRPESGPRNISLLYDKQRRTTTRHRKCRSPPTCDIYDSVGLLEIGCQEGTTWDAYYLTGSS
jgi:hypothetical protein